MSRRPLGVYIHIPFCRSKCNYCAFNSVAEEGFSAKKWYALLREDFLGALDHEGISAATHRLSTIYFGGGTPSLMPSQYIGSLITLIKDTFKCDDKGGVETDGRVEVTLEANPEGLGAEVLKGFLDAGVKRLSLGVQSLDDAALKILGRGHGAAEAVEAINLCRSAGFTNISIDLIYGLPGQSLGGWLDTIGKVLAMRPAHISLYNLSIEENTPFYRVYPPLDKGRGQEKPFMDEELELLMYESAVKKLRAAGYTHYEISNLALEGRESRHNQGYWLGWDYMGLGPGAHSFFGGKGFGRRLWNEKDIVLYEKKLRSGSPVAGFEVLSADEAGTEAVLLGLRMLDKGIDVEAYRCSFGDKAWGRLHGKCLEYESKGLVHLYKDRVVLDKSALFTANEVCLGLLS